MKNSFALKHLWFGFIAIILVTFSAHGQLTSEYQAGVLDGFITVRLIQIVDDQDAGNFADVNAFVDETKKIYEQAGIEVRFDLDGGNPYQWSGSFETAFGTLTSGDFLDFDVEGDDFDINTFLPIANFGYLAGNQTSAGGSADAKVINAYYAQNISRNGNNSSRGYTSESQARTLVIDAGTRQYVLAHEIGHLLLADGDDAHSGHGGGSMNLMQASITNTKGLADIAPDGEGWFGITETQRDAMRGSTLVTAVPEPMEYALFSAIFLIGFAFYRRRFAMR